MVQNLRRGSGSAIYGHFLLLKSVDAIEVFTIFRTDIDVEQL